MACFNQSWIRPKTQIVVAAKDNRLLPINTSPHALRVLDDRRGPKPTKPAYLLEAIGNKIRL
jgi:hypothetical protein